MSSYILLELDTTAPVLAWSFPPKDSIAQGEGYWLEFTLNKPAVTVQAQFVIAGHTTTLEVVDLGTSQAAFVVSSLAGEGRVEVIVTDDVGNSRAYSYQTAVTGDAVEAKPSPTHDLGLSGGGGGGGGRKQRRQIEDKKLHPPTGIAEAIAYAPVVEIVNDLSWHDEREDEEAIIAAVIHFDMI